MSIFKKYIEEIVKRTGVTGSLQWRRAAEIPNLSTRLFWSIHTSARGLLEDLSGAILSGIS